MMTHFDSTKPLVLTCDASPYGVVSVLAHIMEDGEEKPIAYHSRRLSPAEKKYAQIDKEDLAVIVGLAKFHKYLWGRPFLLGTDHRPPALLVWGEEGCSANAVSSHAALGFDFGSTRIPDHAPTGPEYITSRRASLPPCSQCAHTGTSTC